MTRSDHSMVPPAPVLTIAFKSPNACNNCHKDKSPEWADQEVRKWRKRDYQAPLLHRAGLIDAARKRDWARLPDMLAYIESKDRDEVFSTSLLRLLAACDDDRKWPTLLKSLQDPSPLVRSAAVESLATNPSKESAAALISAASDSFRLVRIRAAAALAGYPAFLLRDHDLSTVQSATEEYLTSLLARPDQWTSHYNLGNYYLNRGKLALALAAFETASKLDPTGMQPLVNVSIVHARMGEPKKAEKALTDALSLSPTSAAAHFNMGLVKAELGDLPAAEQYLRKALQHDPTMAEAAYNLSVVVSKDRLEEAIDLARKAAELRPREPKYAYTLGFFCYQKGDVEEAARVLRQLVQRHPLYAESYFLLGELYEKQGKIAEAEALYRRALAQQHLPAQGRRFIEARLKRLPPK